MVAIPRSCSKCSSEDRGGVPAPTPAASAPAENTFTTDLTHVIFEALADLDAYEEEDQDGLGTSSTPAAATTAACALPAEQAESSGSSEKYQTEVGRRRNRGRARKHRAAARAAAAAAATPSTTAVVDAAQTAAAAPSTTAVVGGHGEVLAMVLASRARRNCRSGARDASPRRAEAQRGDADPKGEGKAERAAWKPGQAVGPVL